MRFPTLCSVALFVAAPLSAQAFQGTIAMRASDPQSGAVMDMTVYTDGTKQAMVMTAVGGPAAGREMRAVINPATRKMTMLLALPGMNQGGRNANRPAWANAFGDRPFFPLKVWTKENSVSMEVTSVKRGAVAAEVFDENPAGYMTAPAMPGARRN